MLRGVRGGQQKEAGKVCDLVVFSVGGLRLAARTEDVGGVVPWKEHIPVPSRTPFVNGIVRQDKTPIPVYDLAAQMNVSVQGNPLLCLLAKHEDGPVAICIDADIPSLHRVESSAIRTAADQATETIGSFRTDTEDIPILAIARLGKARLQRLTA